MRILLVATEKKNQKEEKNREVQRGHIYNWRVSTPSNENRADL